MMDYNKKHEISVYLTEEQLDKRIAEIGAEITKRFAGESVYLVCICRNIHRKLPVCECLFLTELFYKKRIFFTRFPTDSMFHVDNFQRKIHSCGQFF